jgi:sec-independent protein translocase protein TatC
MVFLAKVGLVSVAFLNRNRKYSILINFIVAAILTPTPDVINQVLMAVPLMILYEIGVVAVWAFGRKGFSGFRKEDDPDTDEKNKLMDIKE